MRVFDCSLKVIFGAFVLQALAVIPASAAGYTAPTFIGTTEQDVGVMDRPRPAYNAKGVPLGGFRLFPTLDLQSNYDDNVFRQPTGVSDWFFTISPAMHLQSEWGRHFLELYANLDDFQYINNTSQNLTNWKIGSDGRWDISRVATVTGNVNYGEASEAWESPNSSTGFQAAPNRFFLTHTDLSAAYQPDRLGLVISGSFDRQNWQNTPIIGGGVLPNSDRNENEFETSAKAFYDFSPGYSTFVTVLYNERSFDQQFDRGGLDRSSHGYHVDGGVDMQLTHLVTGELFLGYFQQFYAQNVPTPLSNVSGLDYGAQIDWFATPVLTVHLTGSRKLADVILVGASGADNKSVSVSADYEFRPNIIVQTNVSYMNSRMIGTSRTDDYPTAGIGVKYLVNRYMSLNVRYNYSNRSSNSVGSDFTDNALNVSISLHI